MYGDKGVYGNYFIDVENDFVRGENKRDLIFSPTLLDKNGKRVISQIWMGEVESPKIGDSNIRILYFAPTQSIEGDSAWTFTSKIGDSTEYVYPYAGHLDCVEGPDVDLNFGFPYGFIKLSYYNYDAWTNNNIFNRYHKNMMDEIIDKNSKLITASLYLKPVDIESLDFRNLFIVDGNYLRLNKIIDYSLTRDVPTKCEFIQAGKVPTFVKSNVITALGFENLGIGPNNTGSFNPTPVQIDFNSSTVAFAGSIGATTVSDKASQVLVVGSDGANLGEGIMGASVTNSPGVRIEGGTANVAVINSPGITVTRTGGSQLFLQGVSIGDNFSILGATSTFIDAGLDEIIGGD